MATIDWEQTRQRTRAADGTLEKSMEDTPEQIADAYRERAERLAEPRKTDGFTPPGMPVLVFRLEKERYGIELAAVSAVLGPTRMTPVPEAEGNLEGLVNVNGTIRPVLNLRFLLKLPPAGPNTPEYFLLLRQRQRELGVKVEEIEQISALPLDDPGMASGAKVVQRVHGSTLGALTVLRTSALFSEFWDERSEA
jgi:chemotaxis signal transduction protein